MSNRIKSPIFYMGNKYKLLHNLTFGKKYIEY